MRPLREANGTTAWLAAFGEGAPPIGDSSPWTVSPMRRADRRPTARKYELALLDGPAHWSPSLADTPACRIIFDGVLHNRAELRALLGDRAPREAGDAELVGHAYQRWGADALPRLKGAFALLIEDGARDQLVCARDPLGMHPLFYAETPRALLLSPSVDTLLAHPDVSTEIDRACLVDRLTKHWLERDATCFTSVKRVPPGHILRVGVDDRHVFRYWSPVPPGRPFEWMPDADARERFPVLLEQAVDRCLASGPAGVYLSGGLDSATVTMVTADLCRRRGRAGPWALSLLFPVLGPREVDAQRGVATALGLPHIRLPVDEAAGPGGTLAAALEMVRTTPAPLSLIWRPALVGLALHGQAQGCGVILSGDGADEWLWENPLLAADFARSLDVAALYRLGRSYVGSYHFSRRHVLRLLWRHGARNAVRDAWRLPAIRLGAGRLIPRHWRFPSSISVDIPPWVAPDPTLRTLLARRLEARYSSAMSAARVDSYYLQDTRARLDRPEHSFLQEEGFLLGRRIGIPTRQPFWDADLIDFLVRVHPRVRSEGGLAKALVRSTLVRRFPHLGFARQRKSWLGAASLAVIAGQAANARRAMGTVRALVELGVVNPDAVEHLMDDALDGTRPPAHLGLVWDILNLEAWARAHR
jgi:asparagine synthase (glutamine-hydrolysing)